MRPEAEYDYDVAVIGAGPGGQSAAELAAHFGRRVLIVEATKPGGAITTTGGAPTKTLREAALYLTGYRQEEVYGLRAAAPLEVALPIIGERTAAVCARLQDVVAGQIARRGIDYRSGAARLLGGGRVRIASAGGVREIVARTIIIATGSRPTRFPGISFDDTDIYDSDRIYDLRRVPRDIVIVGGGPVGVEFATIFTALGIPATLVNQADRLLPMMDAELVALLEDEFRRRGVTIIGGAGASAVRRDAGDLKVTLSTGEVLPADAVLFAAGRSPNTEGLGLHEAGVALDARGRIEVDPYFRTTAEDVYAVGDVTGPTLASIAAQQGRAAACHALGLVLGSFVDHASSSAVYGLPEIAGVGLTEEEARAAGIPIVVGRADLATTPRGAIAGHGGRLKLVFRADDRRLLGVHCIGDIASELVGMGHAAMHLGGTVDIFLTLALNTPTYSSAYRDAAIDGLARLSDQIKHRPGAAIRHELRTATVGSN